MRSVVAALTLLAVFPAAAQASYDPLASGQATLTIAPSLRSALHREGIRISGRKGATVKGQRTATLPVRGGEADPSIAKGTWELQGELLLSSSRKRVPFTFIQVKAKPTPLFAKVGGGQQKVAKAKSAAFRREGFGFGYRAKSLRLSQKTATRLDKRLHTSVFTPNVLLGSLRVSSQPKTLTVTPQGRATLAIAPTFAQKLASLHASLNPIAPAELGPGPTLSFPILPASTIAPSGAGGVLRLGGEAELLRQEGVQNFGQLFWKEPWLELDSAVASVEPNLQPAPPLAGKGARAPLFSLSGTQVSPDPGTLTVSLSDMALILSPQAAQELNETLAIGTTAAFAAGEALGTLTVAPVGE